MPKLARDREAAGDRAATLNEQVAEGHEWAAKAKPDDRGDLHEDAASKHRRAAGKGRSEAETARAKDGDETTGNSRE